jgi:hypothetical protein
MNNESSKVNLGVGGEGRHRDGLSGSPRGTGEAEERAREDLAPERVTMRASTGEGRTREGLEKRRRDKGGAAGERNSRRGGRVGVNGLGLDNGDAGAWNALLTAANCLRGEVGARGAQTWVQSRS